MKNLQNVHLGDHDVEVTATEIENGGILLLATCGETKKEHVITHHPNHEYAEAQFHKDLDEARLLVAKEAAGHEQTRILRKKFFAD